ncbi:hypothetical protein COLO4_27993 [Corchorus olitorius]|uniref:Uncharacterized protein n=1 Tax=Corchorus olitorius TaxID=93759 RepID=A0A1R3HNE3_9ROSI|nr:hypothetical protein COLO4_27993 [Corchorus olitorius]
MAQWERARLEAEARLVKESKKLVSNKPSPQMKRNKALAAAPPCRSECLDVLKAWQSVVTGMFGINTYNNLEPQQPPPTTMFLGNPIDLTAVACGNMGGTGEFMSDDKPNQNLPELNERFDNSMCLHDTTYQYWTASAAGNNMVEDFWDISVHDFDYPMEEGNLH